MVEQPKNHHVDDGSSHSTGHQNSGEATRLIQKIMHFLKIIWGALVGFFFFYPFFGSRLKFVPGRNTGMGAKKNLGKKPTNAPQRIFF